MDTGLNDAWSLRYEIDADDRLIAVDEGWCEFATTNDGDRLLPPGVLGGPLWTWIADDTTRQIYQTLVQRVRRGSGSSRFGLRCDSPGERRLIDMEISPGDRDHVVFRTRVRARESRTPVALLSANAARTEELLTICSWCSRVPLPGAEWIEIEQAVARLRLFERDRLPSLTHGMCPSCYETVSAAFEARGPGRGDIVLGS